MKVKFRVTSIERYLAGHEIHARVTLKVVHSGQPPWPVAGEMNLDLEETNQFLVGEYYGFVFGEPEDESAPQPKEPFAFQMRGFETPAENIERLAASFVEWANR